MKTARLSLIALALTTALVLPGLAFAKPVTLTVNMNSYGGRGAYLAVYVTDPAGAYAGSLWMAGGKAKYYRHLNFPPREYQADSGPQLYRRGLYTHWQRTFLHPMLKAFDGKRALSPTHQALDALSFDAWLLEPQLPDVIDLARAFPDTTIVLDHVGALGRVGLHVALRAQHLGHALAVIDVHLATVGLDEKLLRIGHGAPLRPYAHMPNCSPVQRRGLQCTLCSRILA